MAPFNFGQIDPVCLFVCFVDVGFEENPKKKKMAAFCQDAKGCFPEYLKPLSAGQVLRSLPLNDVKIFQIVICACHKMPTDNDTYSLQVPS